MTLLRWESKLDRRLKDALDEVKEEQIQSLEKQVDFWKNEAMRLQGDIEKLRPFATTFNESFGTNLVISQNDYTVEEGSSNAGGYLEISRFVSEGKRRYESEKLDKRLAKEFEELSKKYPDVNAENLPQGFWDVWGEKTLLEAYEILVNRSENVIIEKRGDVSENQMYK